MRRKNQSNESYIKIEDVKEMNTNQNSDSKGPKTKLLEKIEFLTKKINSQGIQLDEYKKLEKELKEATIEYESMPYDPEAECTYHAGVSELIQDLPTFRNAKFVLSRDTYGKWNIQDISNECGSISLLLKLDENGLPTKVYRTIINSFTQGQPLTKSYDLVLNEATFQTIPKPLKLGTGIHSLIKNAPNIDGNCTVGLHSEVDVFHPENRKGQDFVRKENRPKHSLFPVVQAQPVKPAKENK